MKTIQLTALSLVILCTATLTTQAAEKEIPNRLIDYPGFLSDASEVGKVRQSRRISESDFILKAADKSTIVLDARSSEKFALLHVKGAKHLSLPDFTEAELARIIPDKSARVLIYCNNNFEREPAAFASKAVRASLNIYTFNSLYSYGYTNVYELGPLLDITTSKLDFEGTLRERPEPATANGRE